MRRSDNMRRCEHSCAGWVVKAALPAVVLLSAMFAATDGAEIRFRDVAAKAGIDFTLENHPTAEKHMIETMAGGVAAFDFNSDGRIDLFFTNGAELPSLEKTGRRYENRLYRNNGGMKFTDVTDAAGLQGVGYSMGAAAGDYDNDGHSDLFVAGVYRNLLYWNRGDGTFEDVTARSGIRSDKWAVAGGWFDFDNDGLLDLFVVNYARWTPKFDRFCGDTAKNIRIYCHPKYFEGLPNALYRNRGDGTFEDVSEKSGIGKHIGRGMSVAFNDYDGDGYLDVFVTNDNLPNFLFHNRRNGTFDEVALLAGAALLDHGKAVASMGADFRDYDNDGLPDISVTALFRETFPLFRNTGKGLFADATYSSRIGPITANHSGWSNGFFDFDNDGWKDLFTANSHVNDRVELFEPTQYKDRNAVFVNGQNGTFRATDAGFDSVRAHRGSAFADLNGDGRIDVAVSALGEPAELWENISSRQNHWVIVKLRGRRSNRDGIGAQLRIGRQWNIMTTAVGYASSSHSGVHFGLGTADKVEELHIRWPSGTLQVVRDIAADQVIEVQEP
jgi:enediyne biosynthesis protein E4